MIELKSRIHKVYVKRFKQKSGEPKYGSVNKGFTELELQHLLRNAPNGKFRLLFKYQAYLGLRIGEVTKLHMSNIDFEKRELTINSEDRPWLTLFKSLRYRASRCVRFMTESIF